MPNIPMSKREFGKLLAARKTADSAPKTMRKRSVRLPKGQTPVTLEAVLITDHIEKRLDPRDECAGIRLLLREGICALKLALHGVMRTKKNSLRSISLPNSTRLVLPSKAYCEWCKEATTAVMLARLGDLKLDFNMNFAAVFYMPLDNCDLTGLKDGLADFAQSAGLITNDKLIRTWDGSRVVIDKVNPRVEVVISLATGVKL